VGKFFGLADGRSAKRLYDSVDAIKDPLPEVSNHTLDIMRKNKFWNAAQAFKNAQQLQQDAPKWKIVINELRLEQVKETKPNTTLEELEDLDARTYAKLIDWAVPERRSTTKVLTQGRIQGQQEPRNVITCAAAVQVLDKHV
jgi:hypothetical protein